MPTVKIYNQKGETVGDIKLSEKVFGVSVNEALVHQAAIAQMARERQVLAHTKDRSEVRGGGKKPWKQKGTGRARAGSSRSPIWVGGGVTFGPTKDRNFSKNINKKMKQKALLMALSDKAASGRLTAMEGLAVDEFKTKKFNGIITGLEKHFSAGEKSKSKRSILVINGQNDEKVRFSARNIRGVKVINLNNINLVDLLAHKNLILTVDSIKMLEERYA